jgi:transposase
MLTDRDPAFCVGQTADGKAILAPDWVDLAALLRVVPKARRPYCAQTKGKVERMVWELKESCLPWLERAAEAAPAHPSRLGRHGPDMDG